MGYRIEQAREKEMDGKVSFFMYWLLSAGESESDIQHAYAVTRLVLYILLPSVVVRFITGIDSTVSGIGAVIAAEVFGSLLDKTDFFKRFSVTVVVLICAIMYFVIPGFQMVFGVNAWHEPITPRQFIPAVAMLGWVIVVFIIENITESGKRPDK